MTRSTTLNWLTNQHMVGLGGLCPDLRTMYALSGMVRRQAVVKWMQPPSGKIKRSVADSNSDWQHI